ncbi:hypothetical protein [Jiella marina]|uniref:hypothetical protein n=1 Tax=Jiella sp. LLJ827 TaxID=2917712 RepID=UPI00210155D2|nr:hypothetical protein [Jiella sp. LLJ827]MCQ0987358.1 hypothetical protein [Jiella sp. LLJ827]
MRETRLKAFLDTRGGRLEVFMQNWIIGGNAGPLPEAHMREKLDQIAAGTVEDLDGFLARHGHHLRIGPGDVPRKNVTANRDALVPQEEVDEALEAHGDMLEEAREIYRMVRQRELALAR